MTGLSTTSNMENPCSVQRATPQCDAQQLPWGQCHDSSDLRKAINAQTLLLLGLTSRIATEQTFGPWLQVACG
eukprot:5600241-Lingulodinium_polyedra.AAC.1